jgi:hypothetical protein
MINVVIGQVETLIGSVRTTRGFQIERNKRVLCEVVENKRRKNWCARRDSNSRPNAPEAFALSS